MVLCLSNLLPCSEQVFDSSNTEINSVGYCLTCLTYPLKVSLSQGLVNMYGMDAVDTEENVLSVIVVLTSSQVSPPYSLNALTCLQFLTFFKHVSHLI